MATVFSSQIFWWIRQLNEFEVEGNRSEQPSFGPSCCNNHSAFNSLERIQDYIEIEQEPQATTGGDPPAYWPSSGEIQVEGLSARYSADGPEVIHNISFRIKSGERVGIGEIGKT